MPYPTTIAIDGPAASGKSTLALKIAQELGYLYFDTGVMYRAVTFAALQRGIPIPAENEVSELAKVVNIDVRPPTKADGRVNDILLDGVDITWEIRSAEVDGNVSPVSTYPEVRRALTEQQRKIGQRGAVVMVGRDIGTVVLPDADLKIYLDASVEERARRRYLENQKRGVNSSYEEILQNLKTRDHIDSTRTAAPLSVAADAKRIMSDGMDQDQVFATVMQLVENVE
jgi:cytidylate kinase